MPRNGCITFGDIAGKLTLLRIDCRTCGRSGQYRVDRLLRQHGRDASLMAWKAALTADCPRGKSASIYDQCGARMPDLSKLMKVV